MNKKVDARPEYCFWEKAKKWQLLNIIRKWDELHEQETYILVLSFHLYYFEMQERRITRWTNYCGYHFKLNVQLFSNRFKRDFCSLFFSLLCNSCWLFHWSSIHCKGNFYTQIHRYSWIANIISQMHNWIRLCGFKKMCFWMKLIAYVVSNNL